MSRLDKYKDEVAQLLNEACLLLTDEEYEQLIERLKEEGFVW